jgi:hypothetical protein
MLSVVLVGYVTMLSYSRSECDEALLHDVISIYLYRFLRWLCFYDILPSIIPGQGIIS